jgi:hypothetical protein
MRAWIVDILLLKITLSCFYQIVFLVYMLFWFFLYGCNLSDLWIPEVVEDLLSSCPSFMVHRSDIFFFLLVGCNLS